MTDSPITSEQLRQPADLVARGAARSQLRRLLEESARLTIRSGEPAPSLRRPRAADEDPEAIHDFRVALRRLRSWLQAFRPILEESISKRSEERLRRLLRIAGPARDVQVGRELLLEIAGTRHSVVAVEARRIAGRFQREEFGARRKLVRAVVRDLSADAARLAAELQADLAGSAADPTLAAALASLLRRRLRKVRSTMGRLVRGSRMESYHEARIAVKRLRYLLEVFDGTSRLAASAVLRLTAIQDALGRLNDELVLAKRLTDERAKLVLRRRMQRRVAAARRRAYTLSRSRDVAIAWDAATRLIRRLSHHR